MKNIPVELVFDDKRLNREGDRLVRKTAREAAKEFIGAHFPTCELAILAGSVARAEETTSSDIDLILFLAETNGYRESFFAYGWPFEVFVHSQETYLNELNRETQVGRSLLGNMLSEGIALIDDGSFNRIKQEAINHLKAGPAPLTREYIEASRYVMGNCIDDLIDVTSEAEALMIVNTLSIEVPQFILRYHNQWQAKGKSLSRALYAYDYDCAERFFYSLQAFYKKGQKDPIIAFIQEIYEPIGGFLFSGFRREHGK
ncbi:hypothetical protein JOC54_002496 [Alkalihalobacillus xiaoxiensis]|uniref:Nucleotidyltransferase-like protein n=1 Tax=Shouchella xiaoxiensis TaxID=766895 RepID=A0ABS2SVF6_9BACI|nr:nucleotidyltransferase domain-containing protein [Shouchella xiaoxiensis]MBM7839225.1 hypothetical protein [Shouchella xiaoxiensis]